jgi:lysophospholipase L1-like esterase
MVILVHLLLVISSNFLPFYNFLFLNKDFLTMKHILKYSWLIVLGAFTSCDPEIEESNSPSVPDGVSITNYVAIGNSLTAGYADGGLYEEAQKNSYPLMIATKLKEVGGATTFNQPTITGNGSGYNALTGFNGSSPNITRVAEDASWKNKVAGKFQNLGVPGIRIAEITVPNWPNDYLLRMVQEGQAKSYLDLVKEADINVYTCWLGSNDVLGYATNGGGVERMIVGGVITDKAWGASGNPAALGLYGITSKEAFIAQYNQVVAALKAKNAKGVVATIPNVTDIPYFTAVGWNKFPLDEAQATTLNAGIKGLIDGNVKNAVTKVATETQVVPGVIAVGATLQLVIPPVITEAVKQSSVIPAVITSVAAATGLSAQETELRTAYFAAYATNPSSPSASGSGFPQEVFDAITSNTNAQMQSDEVKAGIADFVAKYSAAYTANQNAPVATAPYTQAQFDGITAVVKQQIATDTFKNGVAAQVTAYLADPNNPAFAQIKATVDAQVASPTVQAAINAEVAKQIEQLKNGGFYPVVKAGENPFIVSDATSPTTIRNAKSDDLICLTALGELGRLSATGQAPILGNLFVLTKAERDLASTAINDYNTYIKGLAEADANIALFDANKMFSDIVKSGYRQDGFSLSARFISGGLFSLDGVHPTPRGYAIVANEMIKAMNGKFKTNISQVNIGDYRTVIFPNK